MHTSSVRPAEERSLHNHVFPYHLNYPTEEITPVGDDALSRFAHTLEEVPMTPDEILSIPPKLLSQKQRQRYFEDGFILLEKFLSDDWIARLRAVTERMVEESRQVTKRDEKWDIEPDHTADHPRLRRLSSPTTTIPSIGNMLPAKVRTCPMPSPIW